MVFVRRYGLYIGIFVLRYGLYIGIFVLRYGLYIGIFCTEIWTVHWDICTEIWTVHWDIQANEGESNRRRGKLPNAVLLTAHCENDQVEEDEGTKKRMQNFNVEA